MTTERKVDEITLSDRGVMNGDEKICPCTIIGLLFLINKIRKWAITNLSFIVLIRRISGE